MPFVIDATVALAWCFEDAANPEADAALDRLPAEGAVAPALWPTEVANALLAAERHRRLTQAQTTGLLGALRDLAITVEETPPATVWGATLALAREQELSVYEAAYLELALRRGLPLATQDARLRDAAGRLGIALI